MSDTLLAEEFTPSKRHLVDHFYFGDAAWEREIADWIKGDEVEESIDRRGTKVWVYRLGNDVIGYGSVGPFRIRWPLPDGGYTNTTIIPMLGVLPAYQGEPAAAAREDRYSSQIMGDILARAVDFGNELVLLYVHPDNERAKSFYKRFGFLDSAVGRNGYHVMALKIL